jgi:plasmid stability protein
VVASLMAPLQEPHPTEHLTAAQPAAARHKRSNPEEVRSTLRQAELLEALDDASRPLVGDALDFLSDGV